MSDHTIYLIFSTVKLFVRVVGTFNTAKNYLM